MDEPELLGVAMQFLAAEPAPLLVQAAVKDFAALLQAAPANPASLSCVAGGRRQCLEPLAKAISCLKGVILRTVVPGLRRLLTQTHEVVSPWAGGVRLEELLETSSLSSTTPLRTSGLAIACANPGRAGFAHLGSDDVLWWRIRLLASALQEERVDVCVLPGARWPPGAILPPGFPYVWMGRQTCSWDSVGLWVSAELEHAAQVLEDYGSDRDL
jgi:hypothetical protein